MTISQFSRAVAKSLSWRSKEEYLDQVLPEFFLSLLRQEEREGGEGKKGLFLKCFV